MSKVSDESIREKTGGTMEVWSLRIREAGLAEAPHKDIAAWLERKWGMDPWWCQEVTVQFEKLTGRRITGQTAGSGFQVGVSGTFPVSVSRLWEYLTRERALSQFVLEEDPAVLVKEEDGGTGKSGIEWKITVSKEDSHFRMKWKLPGWEEASILQVRITEKGPSKSSLTFHHEKLSGPEARGAMKKRWQGVLEGMKRDLG